MGERKPFIPPIPPDAKTAGQHAAPADLTNPAPYASSSEGAPPQPAQDETGFLTGGQPTPEQLAAAQEYARQQQQAYMDTPQPGGQHPPTEAMYAQLRDDQKKMEKLLLLTTTGVLLAALVILWAAKQKSRLDVNADV